MDSRAFRLLSFPGFLLAIVLVCMGLAVRDFLAESADQLVTVNVALVGGQ